MFGQTQTGLGIETGAIGPAHRLEGQCQHYRISDERFKIHVVVLNLILESFPRMIREKLLELDLDGHGDVDEASAALALGHGIELDAGQNTLVDGLEPGVDLDDRSLANGDHPLAELLVCGDVELMLAHLARAVHEVAHVDAEGGVVMGHEGRFYAWSTPRRPTRHRSSSEAGMSTARARSTGTASPRSAARTVSSAAASSSGSVPGPACCGP